MQEFTSLPGKSRDADPSQSRMIPPNLNTNKRVNQTRYRRVALSNPPTSAGSSHLIAFISHILKPHR